MNKTKFNEVKIFSLKKYKDNRGYFYEFYNKKKSLEPIINYNFVQENISFSKKKGTIRGLHLQKKPFMQTKLIQVIKGSIQDIVLDVRKNSNTYGQYMSVVLKDYEFKQMLIPEGFAHGLLTLEDETIVIYKISNYYSKKHEVTIKWNDDNLNIKWMINKSKAIISNKDSKGIHFDKYQLK